MSQYLDLLVLVSTSILIPEDMQRASDIIWCQLVVKQTKVDVC